MQTVPLLDQRAILIGLAEYCQDVLGDQHYQPIGLDRAEAIFSITKNTSGLCYVQFPTDDYEYPPELSSCSLPLLWKYSAWADSVERTKQLRETDAKNRLRWELKDENVRRIKRAILKQCLISNDQAELLSRRMLERGKAIDIASFGVTLATKEEDLM